MPPQAGFEGMLASLAATESSPSRDRLRVAALVFSTWTEAGREPSGLAGRAFDGALAALEDYVAGDGARPDPQQRLPPEGHPAPPAPEAGSHASSSSGAGGAAAAGAAPGSVPRVHSSQLSYEEFVLRFLWPNRPVLIQGLGAGWRACRDWVTSDGAVDIGFLEARFGQDAVKVHSCGGSGTQCMSVADYCTWWRAHHQRATTPAGPQEPGGAPQEEGGLLYLKDWQFVQAHPDYKAYATPAYFEGDWLNAYLDRRRAASAATSAARTEEGSSSPGAAPEGPGCGGDYRFVYLGPGGSSTAVHTDVLRSYSWSINVAGRKRWHLLPPQHAHLLQDRWGGGTAESFFLGPGSAHAFPGLAAARAALLTCEQGTGEALFVPSGWFHSVANLGPTLSINHNWLNPCNLHEAWRHLAEDRERCGAAIQDCREGSSPAEFEALTERMLGANSGLATRGLGNLVLTELLCLRGAAPAAPARGCGDSASSTAACCAPGSSSSKGGERGGPAGAQDGCLAGGLGLSGLGSPASEPDTTGHESRTGLHSHSSRTSAEACCAEGAPGEVCSSRQGAAAESGPCSACRARCRRLFAAHSRHAACLVLRAVVAELQRQGELRQAEAGTSCSAPDAKLPGDGLAAADLWRLVHECDDQGFVALAGQAIQEAAEAVSEARVALQG